LHEECVDRVDDRLAGQQAVAHLLTIHCSIEDAAPARETLELRRQRLACIDPVAEDDGVAEEDGARAIAVRMLAEIPNHWPEREEIRILEAERSSPLVARMLRAPQQRRHEDVGHHEPEYDEQ